ncbi:rhodanese-like domain-containing protein [Paraferrimonas sp. SM1919]|uniref:rhodanese-like domain-containing protein n=1 Tax=Paraferrimonas sp. SM1919 TaxID=2662263 RepID=UPI0013D765CA|nr:rhodanese-like domain-containing protein [Paraferrimonas sp. SM1919]
MNSPLHDLGHIDLHVAIERLKDGALLIDARPPAMFAQGHIKGAINLPIEVLEQHTLEVPAAGVVVYCAKGIRATTATQWFNQNGIVAVNAGAMVDCQPLIIEL